jgi:RNA-directed DNA polymerase
MNRRQVVARAIADALLAGPPEIKGFIERAAQCLGHRHRWIDALARHVFQRFGTSLHHGDRAKLAELIAANAGYKRAWEGLRPPRVEQFFLDSPPMRPRVGALAACDLPAIATPGELASWLGITIGELDWFADVRGMNPARGPLCHYRYTWIPKRLGSRLVEAPKPRLRELQRRILRGILDRVPAHRCAHGFRAGHSCRTFIAPHVGREVVLRMDLRNFFPGIPASRVHALFETLGYPDAVARLLTALCTNGTAMSIGRQGAGSWMEAKRLELPHLPQGAPTSPSIANLCALHLDLRLDALAASLEGAYSRYADDLAISGEATLRRSVTRLTTLVAAIALEEGFEVNHRKTRAMHRSHRQRLTGIVVNEKPNVPREEFDRLKAVLTNCVRQGASSQNRAGVPDFRAHLAGRVAYVASLNDVRGAKLQAIYSQIDWNP